MKKYYFLPEDFDILSKMINQLTEKIKTLGKQQGEAARQSTENMGHDDACQEATNEARHLTITRIGELAEIINNATVVNPIKPRGAVCLGATVELSDGQTIRIGSYLVLADHQIENVSYNSPLGSMLMGKKEEESIVFIGKNITIKRIS